MGRSGTPSAAFWAALTGVLAGLALAGVGGWILARPPRATLTLVPPPTPAAWLVQVGGAVQRPGLYAVTPGARVADAVAAAGGLTDDADTRSLNLAARLEDGAWVWVPRRAETPPPSPTRPGPTPASAPGAGPINLNTATAAELETLPGIGPALAQRIIDYRTQHGPFTSVDDLLAVRGIGPTKLEQLRPYVTVEP